MTALRVLHVDDESDIREVVEISLRLDQDLVTRSCGSGQEALTMAANWRPDIILLDVMMPVMDGPATFARLRYNAQTAQIPVVFMTARAQSRELDQFRSLGAAGVIPKPFDPMTLAASVRNYLQPADDGLDALRAVFLRRANDDAATLARYRPALQDAAASPAALGIIRDIAHGLAGAGGIFGFGGISEAGAALEEAVIDEHGESGTVTDIESALDRLLACVKTTSALRKTPSHYLLDA